MDDQILKIVIQCVEEVLREDDRIGPQLIKKSTPLYGQNALLDSLGLVRVITGIEESISDKLNKDIVIASEKAMSQRNSPFLNIGTLTDFIIELVNSGDYE